MNFLWYCASTLQTLPFDYNECDLYTPDPNEYEQSFSSKLLNLLNLWHDSNNDNNILSGSQNYSDALCLSSYDENTYDLECTRFHDYYYAYQNTYSHTGAATTAMHVYNKLQTSLNSVYFDFCDIFLMLQNEIANRSSIIAVWVVSYLNYCMDTLLMLFNIVFENIYFVINILIQTVMSTFIYSYQWLYQFIVECTSINFSKLFLEMVLDCYYLFQNLIFIPFANLINGIIIFVIENTNVTQLEKEKEEKLSDVSYVLSVGLILLICFLVLNVVTWLYYRNSIAKCQNKIIQHY